jgi:AraC-like DNA-binding protein
MGIVAIAGKTDLPDPEPFRPVHISTAAFPQARRLAMWREIYGRNIGNFDIEPIGETPFHAEVTFHPLPGVGIAAGSRSAAHYRVTRELAGRGKDVIVVSMLRKGMATVAQFGKEETIGVGSACVLTTTDPSTSTLHSRGSFITLALSRTLLSAIVPEFSSVLGRPIRADNEALRLLSRYLDVLSASDGLTSPEIAGSIATHITDLAALALGARGDRADAARQRSANDVRLLAIRSEIALMLGRPSLSAAAVAASQGISMRHLRRLFEQDGTSFSAFVLAQRLAKARDMLTDRRYDRLSITEIAYEAGFSDLSYFNRSFRRAHGATPSDIRRESMLG